MCIPGYYDIHQWGHLLYEMVWSGTIVLLIIEWVEIKMQNDQCIQSLEMFILC